MLVVSLANAELDYNKAMEHLGGNCKFIELNDDTKYFECDSGFISFDFANCEIILSFETKLDERGKDRKINLLFNRAWNKNHEQIHKEKSVIVIVEDEFDAVIHTQIEKWSDDGGDFYKRFKEDIFYGKQEN